MRSDNWAPESLNWICPYCGAGQLKLDASHLLRKEYEYSKEKNRNCEFEDCLGESCCTGILKCDNNVCGELVSFCGTGRDEIFEADEPKSPSGTVPVYCHIITPLFVHPSPHFIKMSSNYPQTVTVHLKESFGLFWVDKMSCANKLRVVVEDVLNHFGVKRTCIIKKKHKRQNLTTHARLDKFEKMPKFSEPAKYLLAIKWIGNAGSHTGRFDDKVLVKGFSLIEKALDILFLKNDEELRKTCKLINRTNGRVHSTKLPF